jgi:hypothetical protein
MGRPPSPGGGAIEELLPTGVTQPGDYTPRGVVPEPPPGVTPGEPPDLAEIMFQVEPTRPADSRVATPQLPQDVGGRATYALFAVMADGTRGIIPCSGLAWEEQTGEIATRITATLPDDVMEDGRRLPDLITLGSSIAVLAAIDEEQQFVEVARGQVEELAPNDGTGGTFEIVAYDPVRLTLNTKINAYYEAGLSPAEIIRRVCTDQNVPVGEITPQLDAVMFPGPSIFHAETLGDVINKCIIDGQKLGEGIDRIVARTDEGRIRVVTVGSNMPVYWVLQGESAISVRQRISITDLVTQVLVTGKSPDSEAEPPIVTTLRGDLADQFGTRQEILTLTQHVSVDEVKAQALDVLQQKGQPRNDRSIVAPDVPMIRKADQVRVTAGALNDYFSVESIVHDEESRTMTIALGNLTLTPRLGVFSDGLDKEIDESAIPPPAAVGGSGGSYDMRSALTSPGAVGGNPRLAAEIQKYMGVPYVYGGNGTSGIDCSGFTKNVYAAMGIDIPRTAQTQYNMAQKVSSPQYGDLVFFHSTYNSPDYVTHCGIYVGGSEFANAVEPYAKVDNLNTPYWSSKFVGFGRVGAGLGGG